MSYNPDILEKINVALNFVAIFWFVPYTLLVVALLIWSRNKPLEEIKNKYIDAPIWLAILSGGFYFLLSIICLVFYNNLGFIGFLLGILLISVWASIVVGYLCIGLSFLGYNLLQKINFIRD